MPSADSRVLITGATGFIGGHLVAELLRQERPVFVLARDCAVANRLWPEHAVICQYGDLYNSGSLGGACQGVGTVFHLAGYAHAEDVDTPNAADRHQRTTVEGTRALLAEAKRAGVRRFVFASSVKAMGEGGPDFLDESSAVQPRSAYGCAKLEAEKLVLEAGRCEMHAGVIRFPLVYGRGNKGNIPRMIRAIDRGYFPPFPDVENRRSMVHVEDAVQAILLAATNSAANENTYIVTDEQAYSTRAIYGAIRHALGRPIPSWSVPVSLLKLGASAGDMMERLLGRSMPFNHDVFDKLVGSAWYSSAKIARELGFRPHRTFYDALPEMIAEYRQGTTSL